MPVFSVDLSTRRYHGHVVVALRGELDFVDAAAVTASLGEAAAGGPWIILDLAGLEFIDTSGLMALARGRSQARRAGGDLVLAAPQPEVLLVIDVSRPADAFSVYATVEEAAGEAATPPAALTGVVSGGAGGPGQRNGRRDASPGGST